MDAHHHFVTAQELVAQFGGTLDGDASIKVCRFATLARARLGDAAFLAHPKYAAQLATSHASLVILSSRAQGREAGLKCTLIETPDPYLYFARAAQYLIASGRKARLLKTEVHASAVIHPSAKIGQRVHIGALAVVGAGTTIEDDCDIGAGCVIGENVIVGAGSLLQARVTIYAGCRLGERAVVHSGAVIGADGFGFAPDAGGWLKIPQVGGVVIGHDVEIGANTTIDRGTLDDTLIGHGVKLDNQIQIAHNVVIGDHTAIAACVGVAGSAKIGAHCQIGGAAGILGHLSIADGTVIGPMSLVMSSLDTPGKYVGVYPLQAQADWEKSAAVLRRLPDLRRRVQLLAEQAASESSSSKKD